MIKRQQRETILCLHQQGHSQREISRLLDLSRHTINKVLRAQAPSPRPAHAFDESTLTQIREAFAQAGGNVVRAQEMLVQSYQLRVPYSTLTRLVRLEGLRQKRPIKGVYTFKPGEEMQHDTSPHTVMMTGKSVHAHCASLVLCFSRRLFIRYYPRFSRFEAKLFLHDALNFMQGSAQRCVIDNTSVVLAAGSGPHAIIAPEMKLFGHSYGFTFRAHAVGHANRKGRVERPFHYVEHNFLAGRRFNSWQDLNQQAQRWCQYLANTKHKRALGMSSDAAYVQEKPHLQPLPVTIPPVYEHHQRIVDSQGYINIDSNRYSAPESLVGCTMDVYKHAHHIELYYQRALIATHQRVIAGHQQRVLMKAHHPSIYRRQYREQPCEAERLLRGQHLLLDRYVDGLKSVVKGRGMWQFKRLLHLKRTYPIEAFIAAIQQAHRYRLYELQRVETLIIQYASGRYFNL